MIAMDDCQNAAHEFSLGEPGSWPVNPIEATQSTSKNIREKFLNNSKNIDEFSRDASGRHQLGVGGCAAAVCNALAYRAISAESLSVAV
jgi:hypothetical protein